MTKKEDIIVDIPPVGESFSMGTKIESVERAKPWYKKWWVWTIVAGVAIGAGTASGGGGSGGGDVPQPTNTGSVTIDSGPP